MDPVERLGLGIPVILLSTIWGVFGLILEVFKCLNERRDLILKMRAGIEKDHGWSNVLWADWIWLWGGTCAFLLTVTGVLWYIPQFFAHAPEISPTLRKKTALICRVVALLPGFAAIGFLVGGVMDLNAMI